jgi:predicted DNA-binding transcriptional regulator AlpA
MSGKVELLQKNTVAKRLGVSERTIEKMVKDRKFPPPLKLGKCALWADDVVEGWLAAALVAQKTWEPAPRRGRPSKKNSKQEVKPDATPAPAPAQEPVAA